MGSAAEEVKALARPSRVDGYRIERPIREWPGTVPTDPDKR